MKTTYRNYPDENGQFVSGCEALINVPCLEAATGLHGSIGEVDKVRAFGYELVM